MLIAGDICGVEIITTIICVAWPSLMDMGTLWAHWCSPLPLVHLVPLCVLILGFCGVATSIAAPVLSCAHSRRHDLLCAFACVSQTIVVSLFSVMQSSTQNGVVQSHAILQSKRLPAKTRNANAPPQSRLFGVQLAMASCRFKHCSNLKPCRRMLGTTRIRAEFNPEWRCADSSIARIPLAPLARCVLLYSRSNLGPCGLQPGKTT